MDIHLLLRGDAPSKSSSSAPSMLQYSIALQSSILASYNSVRHASRKPEWYSAELQARHDAQGGGSLEGVPELGIVSKWRQKERLKTTAVALVLCLNIGVDPPDVIKISPCARLECWVDPLSMQPPKALETIGMPPLRM